MVRRARSEPVPCAACIAKRHRTRAPSHQRPGGNAGKERKEGNEIYAALERLHLCDAKVVRQKRGTVFIILSTRLVPPANVPLKLASRYARK